MEAILNELKTIGISVGLNLLYAALILVIGFRIVKWIEKLFKKGKALEKLDPNVKSFLISAISITLKALVLICAATTIGIPMTSIITLLGSFALAIGLALQGGLSNLAGGIMILMFKPFKSGDYIETEGKEGTVSGITLFYTILTTNDNKRVMLPNGELTNSSITNYTALPTRRLDVTFEVAYQTPIDKVKKILQKVIDDEPLILENEQKFIRLTEQKESSLAFTIRCYVKSTDYLTAKYNMLENVKEAFDKNKIEIPYKQVDIHMKEN